VTRITTPFDNFMADLAAAWEDFWMLGVITLGALVVIAAALLLTRQRSRAKFREPQYRRHTYWE
jgi:threonine/homoserine/homoserine lactone efflux protein